MPARWSAVLAIGASILLFTSARAHDFDVDQEAVVGSFGAVTALAEGRIGQQFVPQQSSLDVVELRLANGNIVRPFDVTLLVHIRSQSMDGPILGTSLPLVMPFPTAVGAQHFDFPSPVALTPGEVHIMEVLCVAGTGNVVIWSSQSDIYPQGQAFFVDAYEPTFDLWFREGTAIPVPTAPRAWGALKVLYR